jgi:hypothetical protein
MIGMEREQPKSSPASGSGGWSTRELAERICQIEGKSPQDRRLLADITKRASKALREMRRLGLVRSVEHKGRNFVWSIESPLSTRRIV